MAAGQVFVADFREAVDIASPQHLEDLLAEPVPTAKRQRSDEVVTATWREHHARRQGREMVMTTELERLLDEGLENLALSWTNIALRRRRGR